MLRLATASLAGTAIEFYDFFVYGTAATLVLGPLFFPAFSPAAGTLAAFATFGVGFVARPLGSVLFGHIGDRRGRRPVLVGSLLLTGRRRLQPRRSARGRAHADRGDGARRARRPGAVGRGRVSDGDRAAESWLLRPAARDAAGAGGRPPAGHGVNRGTRVIMG
jgi:hypothetical protein